MDQASPREEGNLADSLGASTAAILKQALLIVRRRKLLLIAGLGLAFVLGAVYYFSRDSVFETRASILVHPLGDALSGRNDDRSNFMPTHIRLVTGKAVLERAIDKLKLNDPDREQWPSADELADALKVTSQKDTEILEVAYRTKDKSGAVPILEAIVGAYLDFVNETHRSPSRDILQILTQQKDELDKQLREKEKELLTLQESGDVLSSEDEKNNVALARFSSINNAYTQASMRRLELEARFQALKKAIARGESIDAFLIRDLDRMGPELVAQSLGLRQESESHEFHKDAERRAIANDQLELQHLSTALGPNHPRVLMVQERIRLATEALKTERMTPEEKAKNQQALQNLALLLLESDIKEARTVEADLKDQCQVEKAVAVEFNAKRAPYVSLEMELKRLRGFYDTLNLRIRQVDLGGDAGAISTQVIEPAQEPTSPVEPNLRKIALVSALLGLLCGLALCYLFEWWDTSYRGPEDIAQHLGLPVYGHVPRMTLHQEGKIFELVMEQAPKSAAAEAFRTVRTALMLSATPPRTFTITSPEPGDGKTLILTNLAIAFAKSGLRVLLIDGDMRRPRLRDIFQLPRGPGLSDLLQPSDMGDPDLDNYIQKTPVAKLDLLASGVNPPNPTELLTSDRFAKIMSWAEQRYDRILCDAPPILAVSDCALIGRQLEGAFLLIRADKNDRVMATRARNALRAMNCNVLGVIVNSLVAGDAYGYAYYRKSAYYSSYYQQDGDDPGPDKKVA
ncbi:MAG TPA: polysaccharide biosynthesis tyrosine autokinase [Gemmataceae bacterium]